jgi:glutathione S-transferase
MLRVLVASGSLSCLPVYVMLCPLAVLLQTFNCVQRAHQNSLENQPIFLTLLTLSGLQYPVTAATFGGLYLAGRIGYVEVRSSGGAQSVV